MRIGVPREIKTKEFRVGMTPAGVASMVQHGHQVVVERGAGLGSAIPDDAYTTAGAKMVDSADEVWATSEMIVKVKEPIAPEYARMREGQVLFTYLHLAAAPELGAELLKRKVSGVAYETIEPRPGQLTTHCPAKHIPLTASLLVQDAAPLIDKNQFL